MPLLDPEEMKLTERIMVKKFDHTGDMPKLVEVVHRESVKGGPWKPYQPVSPLNGAVIRDAANGIVACSPARTKLALIVGPTAHIDIPWSDPDWEIWSFGTHWTDCLDDDRVFRADRWFELRPLRDLSHKELCDVIKCPIPLYMADYDPHVPMSVKCPIPLDMLTGHDPVRTMLSLAQVERLSYVKLFPMVYA